MMFYSQTMHFFDYAYFDSTACFQKANFGGLAHFMFAKFHDHANFSSTNFHREANFYNVQFDSIADFSSAKFHERSDLQGIEFWNKSYFYSTEFYKTVFFCGSEFHKESHFNNSDFKTIVEFTTARFHDLADFRQVKFEKEAIFDRVKFFNYVNFGAVDSLHNVNFSGAYFYNIADFREAQFCNFNFDRTEFWNEIHIGSRNDQIFDFTRSIFKPHTKIVFMDVAQIKLQIEKFKHIHFGKIRYDLKRVIIDDLKLRSFKNNKRAQFELEYIFEKSTMFEQHDKENKWYYVWKWLEWLVQIIYYITMGLGYRPIWLFGWSLLVIIYFSFNYLLQMPDEIDTYIKRHSKLDKSDISDNVSIFSTVLNCFYFSTMVFFTFRLRSDVLAFFDSRDKRTIISEWLLGFGAYVAFLTLSKAGSILHTLKSLFVG